MTGTIQTLVETVAKSMPGYVVKSETDDSFFLTSDGKPAYYVFKHGKDKLVVEYSRPRIYRRRTVFRQTTADEPKFHQTAFPLATVQAANLSGWIKSTDAGVKKMYTRDMAWLNDQKKKDGWA